MGPGFPSSSEVKNLPANAGGVGSIPGPGRSPGEGNGNPLQYSCLGNPMDRGVGWAAVLGLQRVRRNLPTEQQWAHRDFHILPQCPEDTSTKSLVPVFPKCVQRNQPWQSEDQRCLVYRNPGVWDCCLAISLQQQQAGVRITRQAETKSPEHRAGKHFSAAEKVTAYQIKLLSLLI